LVPVEDGNWKTIGRPEEQVYRLCENYTTHNVCNWAITIADDHPLCVSCRLTRVVPDLSVAGNLEAWYKLEVAKRRLIQTLLGLGLPLVSRIDDPENGLAFEFKADPPDSNAPPVLTGHAQGVITINIAEADDAEREKRRLAMGEPYRTLLGHFRHEVGHYYWDRLIAHRPRLEQFRVLFGDDRADYAQAIERHYQEGAPANWRDRFISSYATMHPWEDWAETWAHYLHMTDTLETAAASGLSLRPRRDNEPMLKVDPKVIERGVFDQMIDAWYPLTYLLNNLNRGLGLADGYPFVLSTPVVEKLRFVHDTIWEQSEKEPAQYGPERMHGLFSRYFF
jgi:hypothetical protein